MTGLTGSRRRASTQADDHRGDARDPGCETARGASPSRSTQARAGLEAAEPPLARPRKPVYNLPSHPEAPKSMQPGSRRAARRMVSPAALKASRTAGRIAWLGQGPLPISLPESALAESRNWLSEPRTTVLVVLGGVVLLGGGRRLLQGWKARKAVARLSEPDITPARRSSRLPSLAAPVFPSCFGSSASRLPRPYATPPAGRLPCSGHTISSLPRKSKPWSAGVIPWSGSPGAATPGHCRSEIPIRATYGLPFLAGGWTGNQAGRPGMVAPYYRCPPRSARGILGLDAGSGQGRVRHHSSRLRHQWPSPPGPADQGADAGPDRLLADRPAAYSLQLRVRPQARDPARC